MDLPTTQQKITGKEHWTKKGDVKLFLWEKATPVARPASPSPTGRA